MGKAPSAPNPQETASASTGTNVGTAIANAMMGNVNQVTPDGSLTYSQSGTHSWSDPYTGQTYDIPTFTATQTLSPEQQAIRQQAMAAQGNLAGIANTLSGNAAGSLSQPFAFNNSDAEQWAYDLASPRILQQQGRNEEALRTRLLNSGIREGSASWNAEMGRLTNANTDQLNQLALSGRAQAYNEARDQYTLPLNMISGLLSGSQVQGPNYVNTSQPTIPTTDTAGIINDSYQQNLQSWQANQAVLGGLMGGVGTLLAAPGTSAFGRMISLSDDNAKKDKKKLGHLKDVDLDVHEYRYKGEPDSAPKRIGLMASEVERKNPSAVVRRNGLRYVDYGKALGG